MVVDTFSAYKFSEIHHNCSFRERSGPWENTEVFVRQSLTGDQEQQEYSQWVGGCVGRAYNKSQVTRHGVADRPQQMGWMHLGITPVSLFLPANNLWSTLF